MNPHPVMASQWTYSWPATSAPSSSQPGSSYLPSWSVPQSQQEAYSSSNRMQHQPRDEAAPQVNPPRPPHMAHQFLLVSSTTIMAVAQPTCRQVLGPHHHQFNFRPVQRSTLSLDIRSYSLAPFNLMTSSSTRRKFAACNYTVTFNPLSGPEESGSQEKQS